MNKESAYKMKTLILILSLASSIASARPSIEIDYSAFTQINQRYIIQQNDCVSEYVTPIGSSSSVVRACYLSKPLEKSQAFIDYPHLVDNPRTVEFWKGTYSKETMVKRRFLRQLVDTCHGRMIDTRNITKSEIITDNFNIANPNLDTTITEDHMLLPMTPLQANEQLAIALQNCLD